jgi:hypothetical protein
MNEETLPTYSFPTTYLLKLNVSIGVMTFPVGKLEVGMLLKHKKR